MKNKKTFKKYRIKRLYGFALHERSDHTGVKSFELLVRRTLISHVKSGPTWRIRREFMRSIFIVLPVLHDSFQTSI